MNYRIAVIGLFAWMLSCDSHPREVHSAGLAPIMPTKESGLVTIDVNSPKLKLIHSQEAVLADVPTNEVVSPGRVEVNLNRVSQVVLPVAGRITAVAVHIGEFVTQGQPLFTMESPEVEAAASTYLQAEASVSQAEAAVSKAQSDVDRTKDLFEHNAIARKELITNESLVKQTQAGLTQNQAMLQQSRRRLELLGLKPGEFNQKVVVRAPISGKVMEMSVVPGEFRNDLSAPLLKLADLSTVWVAADVPETQIRFIRMGEFVDLELSAYPGEKFRGRVKQIADIVDPQSRTVKVRAELANTDGRLKPEMFGQIREVQSLVKVVVVPCGAAVLDEVGSYVWKEEAPGVYRRTKVEVKAVDGKIYAVNAGLKAGDLVVVDGVLMLKGME